ncbi:restriction endonuclease [Lutibacter flavus]|uniref:Restriction endonuclease n=1 Tax=Lutibacter flavus TaxID=691689 RepID=A0A238X7Q7_9FLAO|nr:restriction endonuclease [Lutibacter flavus]SNR53869.1 Restriction endonuclease [Lutibacter flavus]
MKITRTINPLHFEDLEPHRFEDLVRQLMYDFKEWKSIEATGKMGSDNGIDILAIENYVTLVNADSENNEYQLEERDWIIQCKREQKITPKKVESIIKNDIEQQDLPPYGYILVASSNFSKKSRDIFKLTLNKLGVNEFFILGKAEIEDLLFLPKYDHLLFAYFGISLQKRKRNLKSQISSRLTTKRKLIKAIGEIGQVRNEIVFIKPTICENYPKVSPNENFQWRYYYVYGYMPVDSILLVVKKHFAYVDWENNKWDIIESYDDSFPNHLELDHLPVNYYDKNNEEYFKAYDIWNKLDNRNKAYYFELQSIHFDRILVVDEIGDYYHNESPHLIVDFVNDSPFESKKYSFIESESNSSEYIKDPKNENRINIFK